MQCEIEYNIQIKMWKLRERERERGLTAKERAPDLKPEREIDRQTEKRNACLLDRNRRRRRV